MTRRTGLLLVPVILLLSACETRSDAATPPSTAAAQTAAPTTAATIAPTTTTIAPTTTAASTTTTTIAPTTTTIATVPIAKTLSQGAKGDDVKLVQERLRALHFDPGDPDGVFDTLMTQAVWAYQKLSDLPPDGNVTPELWQQMQQPFTPAPLVPGGEPDRVEIDLPRQVLVAYQGGNIVLISHISTGRNAHWPTPGGEFHFTWRVSGWRTSELGRLYNPVYFNKGIAVHGAPEVPNKPASHGCVRIPMTIAKYFPSLVVKGEAVYVQDGYHAFTSPLGMPSSMT
ncbi:MAG TPA: L,D-transpeptidase family protein [Acidimicrobiales bacterium]|nr:L,D-transpeptidase family protein [Acidimicrobiales bacterium]